MTTPLSSPSVRQVQLKLRLTKAQERTLNRWLWHLTGVYNWTIRKQQRSARRLSFYDIRRELNGHSVKMGLPAYAIGGTALTAVQACDRYHSGLAGKPRLKSRRRPLSSIAFDHWGGMPKGRRLPVPGMGLLRFHACEIDFDRISAGRIVKRASGWYACLYVRVEPRSIPRVAHGEVGIDPGFSSLVALSTGEKIGPASEFVRSERRLGQAQRGNGRRLTARLHERIANQRKDRNHKLSRRLVAENELIAFSADSHSKIARRFGKSVASAGHYQLRQMLRYKSLAGGAEYVEVASRNSTRTCSACGGLTGPTGLRGLKVRQWVCTTCGVEHDRDCNAAVNTLIAGRGMRHESHREMASGTAS